MGAVWWFIIVGLVAFLLSFLLVRIELWLFPKIGLMDRPHKYGLTRAPIPYYGGLALIVSFLILTAAFIPMDARIVGMIVGVILIGIVSFLDDKFGVSPVIRLFSQVLAALILVLSGVGIELFKIPFLGMADFREVLNFSIPFAPLIGQTINFNLMEFLVTAVWVVLIMNTMNFLDGLQGLTSGVSALGALSIFILSMRPDFHTIDQGVVATLSLIICMITLAFLFHDFYPAKILMGDSGSMFLGFSMATIAIFSGGKVATAFLVLGFPIIDAFLVILRRILAKKSPLKGDYTHLHHRLLFAGISERKTLLLIYLVCFTFGMIGTFLENKGKFFASLFLVLLMVVLELYLMSRQSHLKK